MLKAYIDQLQANRWQRAGQDEVERNVEMKTSVEAPMPRPDDITYLEPNHAAWDDFLSGGGDGA